MRTITSRQNPLVARYRDLARAARTPRTHVLLDGAHLVTEAVAAGARIETLVVAAAALERGDADVTGLVRTLADATDIVAATGPVVSAVSPVRSPSGVVAIAVHLTVPGSQAFRHPACAVAAVGIQDPGNLGAVIRAADAAGATGVFVTGGSADPFGWKALRGAMGSTFRLPVIDVESVAGLVDDARACDVRVLAAVPRGGRELYDVDLTGALLVLIGGEGAGLDRSLETTADARLSVPMRRPVESLNTAVASALILYEARRQRVAAAGGCSDR